MVKKYEVSLSKMWQTLSTSYLKRKYPTGHIFIYSQTTILPRVLDLRDDSRSDLSPRAALQGVPFSDRPSWRSSAKKNNTSSKKLNS
jgi:hypothetical protein